MIEDLDRFSGIVEAVIKVGGAAFGDPGALDPIARVLASARRHRRVLVVPGGGIFADRVRDVDRRFGLGATAAHWMAVHGMDQAAFLLAEKIPHGVVVTGFEAIRGEIDHDRVPVWAPSALLAEADPLPHSWEVTSDSIAAWMAGRLGARDLVLIKPPGVRVQRSRGRSSPACVDGYFGRSLPDGVGWFVVPADDPEALASVLKDSTPF